MTVPLGNPYALGATGVLTTARTDRLALGAAFRPGAAALADAPGFLHGPAGTRGDLTLLSDALLRVDPFLAVVQGTHSSQQGQYLVPNVQQRDLAVPAKDASQSRRALVVVRVADSLEAGVASSATTDGSWLEIVSGALAASNPALPATPANALLAGELTIPSTGSGQPVSLTRYYPRTVARGACLPLPTEAAILALPTALLWPGFQAYAEDTRANATYDGTRWLFFDTRWQAYTPTFNVNGISNAMTLGTSYVNCAYFRTGRKVDSRGFMRIGTGFNFNGTGVLYVSFPVGYAPSVISDLGLYARVGAATMAGVGLTANGLVAVNSDPGGAAVNRRMVFYHTASADALQMGSGPWRMDAVGHYLGWQATWETDFAA